MQLSETVKVYPTEYQKTLITQTMTEYIDTVNSLVSEAVSGHSIAKTTTADVSADLPSALLNQCIRDAKSIVKKLDCQHFFRQIFLGYFSDIVQAFDTLRKNVCGDDYTSLHNPIVLSSVLPAYGMFHSIQILFL